MVTQATQSNLKRLAPLRRITVSQIFWQAVQDNFPTLAMHKGYPALFWYLIFGAWHDEDTHRLLLPAKLLADIEGRDDENTQAERFLIRFRDDVLPPGAVFRWSQWREGKCRQLLAFHLGAFDDVLAKEYARHWHKCGRVYLDGTPYAAAKQRRLRREQNRDASQKLGLCDDARDIQDYLNSLAPNLFSRASEQNMERAMTTARKLPNPIVSREQTRLLRLIESQPQPFYAPSKDGNTVRLFAAGAIPNLQSDVRRALTRGWQDADLRCAHLAILSGLWKVQDTETFLASGADFWAALLNDMGVPLSQRTAAKRAVKVGLYSICYGMEKRHVPWKLAEALAKEGLDTSLAARFLASSLIQAILPARDKALAEIEAHGGASTPYGKWCPVTNERKARHVMAEIAQAWEMKLIAPAFKLASETNDFTITLYQFDGFTVHFKRRVELWRQRITEAVMKEAKETGIQTTLEWKQEAGTGNKDTGIPIMSPLASFIRENAPLENQKGAKAAV